MIKSNIKHILVRFYLRNSNLIRKINEFGDIINSLFVVRTHLRFKFVQIWPMAVIWFKKFGSKFSVFWTN